MEAYFSSYESIYSKRFNQIEGILETIANRYIGNNPSHPMVYRTYQEQGFKRLSDYRYDCNLAERYPDARDGQVVYAWAKLWMEQQSTIALALNCFGPTSVFINEELVFKSTIVEETNPNERANFRVTLQKGWNHFVLAFMKTPSGLGGVFGTGSFKRYPLHFLTPSKEREGQEGWIFSKTLDTEFIQLPKEGTTEQDTEIEWLPSIEWNEEAKKTRQLARLFGEKKRSNSYAVAWTKLVAARKGKQTYQLKGENKGAIEIYINGRREFQTSKDESFHLSVTLPYGEYDVVIKSQCNGLDWGFDLEPLEPSENFYLSIPFPVLGAPDNWLYMGIFTSEQISDIHKNLSMNSYYDSKGNGAFWRVDQPNMIVRPYLENTLFGKWDYPLGVTLYGLLQTGVVLKRRDIVSYTRKHIENSVSLYHYSLWDKERYGAAGVNNQLSAIDSLDDCGSFGATMLQAEKTEAIAGAFDVAKDVANYITTKQDRLNDNTLYRKRGSVDFMKDTIWCDDLYMSTPFLCRYYELTGDSNYLNDAVTQFINYKKYLYMPEAKIMSHVYDFKFDTATNVPWGRGNGWVLFSLSELLETLPNDHQAREELLAFFQELCEGYLQLQGTNGLWHQVLTDPTSYEETSCTSMFVYAFARGVRYDWLKETQPYIESAFRGWQGMAKRTIDQYGNVYGVCQGSGYSFTGDYYKNDLSWVLNDTHGIGIVLLAGIETIKLTDFLKKSNRILIDL